MWPAQEGTAGGRRSAIANCVLFFALFFHSRNMLDVLVSAMTVQGRADAEKELERIAEIVAVVTVKRIRSIVDGELGAEPDVDTFAV